MTRHTITGNELTLWTNVLTEKPIRLESVAVLPNNDYDGGAVYIHHWEIAGPWVTIRYSLSPDINASMLDGKFPCRLNEIEVQKPGRNFSWSAFSGEWVNAKTGERRKAF